MQAQVAPPAAPVTAASEPALTRGRDPVGRLSADQNSSNARSGRLPHWKRGSGPSGPVVGGSAERQNSGTDIVISTKRRMIVVATLVCGFAVGMSGLLNYFKYRSTINRLVHERILATGRSVENVIQSSLLLGLQFGDIGTLPSTLEREQATDDVITGVDVFDTEGRILYSTDQQRVAQRASPDWLVAVKKAGTEDWFVEGDVESAVGMAIDNNFGLIIGHIALRYSNERVQQSANVAGRQLAISSFIVFIIAAALASLALLAVMRRLSRDVAAVESALRAVDPVRASAAAKRGLFGPALQHFVETIRSAETEIASLRARMHRGASE
ncbi:MAG TPA: hypothetical protein VFB75_19560 [Burkholderiales bacterium]|nr:hypothetical protein [Burkholderiales bacterium]